MTHEPPKPKRTEVAPTATRDPLVDMQLGEYVVKKRLGVGGMGVVYAGVQPVIQKPVAIKILMADAYGAGSDEVAKLIAEARAANAVRHRGIVDVFSFGTLPDGRPYIVMELLEGEALEMVIARDAPLSLPTALAILDDVLDTLSAAHAAGVIHRDLKPGNLFVVHAPDGTTYTKILDFGLAKHSRAIGIGAAQNTRVSAVVGTPHYMAPEQACGQPVSARTDLYALGCIAFEMLTGRLPYEANSPVEMVSKHLDAPVPKVSSLVGGVPDELEDLIVRLLAKKPEDRPTSAQTVRQQLARLRRTLQSDATVARSPLPRPPAAWQPADDKTAETAPYVPSETPTPAPLPLSLARRVAMPEPTPEPTPAPLSLATGRRAVAMPEPTPMPMPEPVPPTHPFLAYRDSPMTPAPQPLPKPRRAPSRGPRTFLAGVLLSAALAGGAALFWRELPIRDFLNTVGGGQTMNPVGEPTPDDKAGLPETRPTGVRNPSEMQPGTRVLPPGTGKIVKPPPGPGIEAQRKKTLARIEAIRQKLDKTSNPAFGPLLDEARLDAEQATTPQKLREIEKDLDKRGL